ncbi:MAG: response regulator transcription factor [Anaerolineae bacterium]|nr:response regulator transcription factor [Anaerolineae bacterium]
MTKIRVLLADDHAVVRDGLHALLAAAPDIEVVGQAADGLEVIQLATELAPDVVVMDIAMPRVNGIEATRRIVKALPDVKVLILSQYEDTKYVLEAVNAGARGYLLKRDAGAELAEGIHGLHRWGAVLHPFAARIMIDAHVECTCSKWMDSYEHLTDREREVLILVAEGYTTPQIAEALHVSPKTVDGHRTSLMSKLDLHDRTEVVKYALKRQLIEL